MPISSKIEILIDALRQRILSGEFTRKGKLPTFRELAKEYKTSQETMNKVMQNLQAEGSLLSLGQKGIFVNTQRVRFPGLTRDLYKYLQEQVTNPIEEYIEEPTVINAPAEVAQMMNLSENSLVLRRFKKQGSKQVIIRIEETFYPKNLLSEAELKAIEQDARFIPLPIIKKKFGIIIKHVNETIICRLPNASEQKLLKIVRYNPVIDITRICYAEDKKTVIMYNHLVANANHVVLSYDYAVEHWK